MKNKTKKRLALIFAVLVIILVQTIGISYAKYMMSDKASAQAKIAKWAFKVTKNGVQTQNIKLIDSVKKDTLVNGKIAPGSSGQFIIVLDATGSEVDIDYAVRFINEQNKPSNLIFNYSSHGYDSISELSEITGKFLHSDKEKQKTIKIEWSWIYEWGSTPEEKLARNLVDTQDGEKLSDYSFDIVITATQSK